MQAVFVFLFKGGKPKIKHLDRQQHGKHQNDGLDQIGCPQGLDDFEHIFFRCGSVNSSWTQNIEVGQMKISFRTGECPTGFSLLYRRDRGSASEKTMNLNDL